MPSLDVAANAEIEEQAPLLPQLLSNHHLFSTLHSDTRSLLSSHVSKDEQALASTSIGERLPYNDYTTIDWLHDLVKDSFRYRAIHDRAGLWGNFLSAWDACQGWVAAALIGVLTALVAFAVDVAAATVTDWKGGFCRGGWWRSREVCCMGPEGEPGLDGACEGWREWSGSWAGGFAVYAVFALVFGVLSSSVTMFTRTELPVAGGEGNQKGVVEGKGRVMYMAAGSGIPEIKTILSGFVIPNFLDFKVLVVKAVGATLAVSTGMCLGKEGPFVHISTCVAYLVGRCFPKYRDNGRMMRELLSAGCSAGLSVAFGAPIGGVLFSYEEISTYFPRKVLWRAFLCSLFAAMILKALNPTGTGKLVLFETNYGTSYEPVHYLVFVFLGVAGGLFGGVFCKANFLWSKTFRKYAIIKNNPVFEVALVVLATALLQYPNPLTREPGDIIIKNLLVDCSDPKGSWVCEMEAKKDKSMYIIWLAYGTAVKLVLTTITFGCKVPSGIIIPALDAGAFFGRLVGQIIPSISPGIFAMVGAAAFLAGVSRMTISLCVIMFELTGELEYIVPHMIAILVAKWVADALEREGVYDLAQTVLGHPFLDLDHATHLVQREQALVEELIPPQQTMLEITIHVPRNGCVQKHILHEKLGQLQRRGLMDAGLVLVQNGMLQGYFAEAELEFGLNELGREWPMNAPVKLLGDGDGEEADLSMFIDRTPLTICAKAPMEYAVEMFGKLGLRYLCIVEEGSGKLLGVSRCVFWLWIVC
jgi:chloride channel 3/4/5